MVGFCLVCKCKADGRPELMFHSFPKDETLRRKWAENMGIKREISKSSRLCSIHFAQDCFTAAMVSGKPMLKKGAIPTILTLEEFIELETYDEEEVETQNLNNENTVTSNSQFQNVVIKEEIDISSHIHEEPPLDYESIEEFSPNEVKINDDEKMIDELQINCRKISVKSIDIERFSRFPNPLKVMYWMEAQRLIEQQSQELRSLRQRCRRYKNRIENLTTFNKRIKFEIKKRLQHAKIQY